MISSVSQFRKHHSTTRWLLEKKVISVTEISPFNFNPTLLTWTKHRFADSIFINSDFCAPTPTHIHFTLLFYLISIYLLFQENIVQFYQAVSTKMILIYFLMLNLKIGNIFLNEQNTYDTHDIFAVVPYFLALCILCFDWNRIDKNNFKRTRKKRIQRENKKNRRNNRIDNNRVEKHTGIDERCLWIFQVASVARSSVNCHCESNRIQEHRYFVY